MTFRIAIVQPIANPIEEAEKNIGDAVNFIARAKAEGADFVCFPETYPGPWRMPASFDPTPALVEAAAKHKTHVVFGTIAPIDDKAATAHNLICMAYPDGRAPAALSPHASERSVDLYRRNGGGVPMGPGQ
jgi:predicted amidohydrolase